MGGERSKEIEDHFTGVIKRLEHATETERKGCEGISEESVRERYFCYA